MKKYPIYYEGKKYQVVWTAYEEIKVYLCKGIFKFSMPLRYNYHCAINTLWSDSDLFNALDPASPDYYIRQAEIAVKHAIYIKHLIEKIEKQEKSQTTALKEWDGVINE